MTTSLSKFDPGDHPNNLYDAFENFIESFAYEYEAITKQPPAGTTDPEEWHEINKRKQESSLVETSKKITKTQQPLKKEKQ